MLNLCSNNSNTDSSQLYQRDFNLQKVLSSQQNLTFTIDQLCPNKNGQPYLKRTNNSTTLRRSIVKLNSIINDLNDPESFASKLNSANGFYPSDFKEPKNGIKYNNDSKI